MDREEHNLFIKPPVNKDGRPIFLKLDQRKIHRVKYCPDKYIHKTDDQGKDEMMEEVYSKGSWSGLLEDGKTVMPVPEDSTVWVTICGGMQKIGAEKVCSYSCGLVPIIPDDSVSPIEVCKSTSSQVHAGRN